MKRLLLFLLVSNYHVFNAATIEMSSKDQNEALYNFIVAAGKDMANQLSDRIDTIGRSNIDRGTSDVVDKLYDEKGKSVDLKGVNALMVACLENKENNAWYLLGQDANANAQAHAPGFFYDGFTPLMFVFQNIKKLEEAKKIVRFLAAETDLMLKYTEKQKTLREIVSEHIVSLTEKKDQAQKNELKELLDIVDQLLFDKLVEAIKNGDINTLEALYEQNNDIINVFSPKEITMPGIDPQTGYGDGAKFTGLNALMIATLANKTEVIQWLLSKGAQPAIQVQAEGESYDDFTSLMFAIQNLAYESAQLLIDAMNKESLELKNKNDRTVFDMTSEKIRELKKRNYSTEEINKIIVKILEKTEVVEFLPKVPNLKVLQKDLNDLRDQLKRLNAQFAAVG